MVGRGRRPTFDDMATFDQALDLLVKCALTAAAIEVMPNGDFQFSD